MLTGAWLTRARQASAAGESADAAGRAQAPSAGSQEGAAAAAAAPSGQSSTPPERIYEVQVAAHLTRRRAEAEVERLAAGGYPATVLETRDSRDRSIFTVRMGPYPSVNEAAAAAKAFSQNVERTELQDLQPVIRHRPKPPPAGPQVVVPGDQPPA